MGLVTKKKEFLRLLIMSAQSRDKKTERELKNFYRTEKEYFFQMERTHGREYYAPILRILKNKKISLEGKEVLDVGSGTGTFIEVLRKVFGDSFNVIGTDISPISKNFHRQKKIKFVLTDANKLPFKDGIFDFVSSVDVFEHLVNPQKALLEMNRVIKKGGFILVRTRNYRSPLSTGSLLSMLEIVKDLLENKKRDLRNTKKLKPRLVARGGDEDAVAAIYIDQLRTSLENFNGEILILETWTKGGFWKILNTIPFISVLGSMSLALFKKG